MKIDYYIIKQFLMLTGKLLKLLVAWSWYACDTNRISHCIAPLDLRVLLCWNCFNRKQLDQSWENIALWTDLAAVIQNALWWVVNFSLVMQFVRYFGVDFKFGHLVCVRYIEDFVVPTFIISGFAPYIWLNLGRTEEYSSLNRRL